MALRNHLSLLAVGLHRPLAVQDAAAVATADVSGLQDAAAVATADVSGLSGRSA